MWILTLCELIDGPNDNTDIFDPQISFANMTVISLTKYSTIGSPCFPIALLVTKQLIENMEAKSQAWSHDVLFNH